MKKIIISPLTDEIEINRDFPKVSRPPLDRSRFQITSLDGLISLYTQGVNYANFVPLTPPEQAEINRLAHILKQFSSQGEERLLEKHVAILEKGDGGVSKELEQINRSDLIQLYQEGTTYQKLAGSLNIKPEIEAKINFTQKIYQRILNQPNQITRSPTSTRDFSRFHFREPVEKPPTG